MYNIRPITPGANAPMNRRLGVVELSHDDELDFYALDLATQGKILNEKRKAWFCGSCREFICPVCQTRFLHYVSAMFHLVELCEGARSSAFLASVLLVRF